MGEADTGAVSGTALRVAVRRAAHQILDDPKVFDDPLAVRIIGPEAEAKLRARTGGKEREWNVSLRAWIAARSRYAEDGLAKAVERGVRQYVVLGAGLDTFACRNPYAEVRVFEVDRSATQAWKRDQLRAAGMALPGSAVLAACDFERESVVDRLCEAGFDGRSAAFFSWLGVTPFLTEEAFDRMLREIARVADGLVFDYAVTPSMLGEEDRFAHEILSRRVAAVGEPYRLFFSPPGLHSALAEAGFTVVEDLGKEEIQGRYFADRADGLGVRFTASRLVTCGRAKRSGCRGG